MPWVEGQASVLIPPTSALKFPLPSLLRPIYLTTLTLYVLACVSLAVIPTSAFWPLLVLRMVQATGGASVIALGSGVVGDIADRKERGSYMGMWSFSLCHWI